MKNFTIQLLYHRPRLQILQTFVSFPCFHLLEQNAPTRLQCFHIRPYGANKLGPTRALYGSALETSEQITYVSNRIISLLFNGPTVLKILQEPTARTNLPPSFLDESLYSKPGICAYLQFDLVDLFPLE